MLKFWSFVSNGIFSVGCTGQTVAVYDASGKELARFRDLKYAYQALFCPSSNLLVVKSKEPWLAFYSLDSLCLLKKLRLRKPNSETQDNTLCFSPDGNFLLNLESQNDLSSQLVVYSMENFSETSRFFENGEYQLSHIEYSPENRAYLLLGKKAQQNFIGVFDGHSLTGCKAISWEQFTELLYRREMELAGFTPKIVELFSPHIQKAEPVDLEAVYREQMITL